MNQTKNRFDCETSGTLRPAVGGVEVSQVNGAPDGRIWVTPVILASGESAGNPSGAPPTGNREGAREQLADGGSVPGLGACPSLNPGFRGRQISLPLDARRHALGRVDRLRMDHFEHFCEFSADHRPVKLLRQIPSGEFIFAAQVVIA